VSAPTPGRFRLSYTAKGQRVVRDFDRPRVLLGRSVVCQVVIDSGEISRRHAEIVRDGAGWAIQDLDSRNGTFVNSSRIARQTLHDGDHITLAQESTDPVALLFQCPDAAAPGGCTVLLHDVPEQTNIRASIDLQRLEQTVCELPLARDLLIGPRPTTGGEVPTKPRPTEPDPGAPTVASRSVLRAISLFKQIGEILLASEELDDLLQQVVNATVGHLPGQRGVICLYDEATGTIEPKFAHAKTPVPADQPCRVSRSILQEAVRVRQAILVINPAGDARFHQAASIHQIGIQSAMCAPLYHAGHVKGVIYLDSHRDPDAFDQRDLEVLTVLGMLVAGGITQMALRGDVTRERAIRSRLSRYNSPRVVEQIVNRAAELDGEMAGEERDVSVLFADLTGFTATAEELSPAEVIQLLNAVFERLTSAVFRQDGTLDKYIGDAVMAVFGAPLEQPDHALRAVRAALLMQQLLDDYNREFRPGRPLQMRIGINSGRAIAGDIGSPLRKEYTVIGDSVNVAARLQAVVAQPGEIVIGPATYELVQGSCECTSLPEVRLRGKRQSLRPYRLVRLLPCDSSS
jgi:adenylate cyclase